VGRQRRAARSARHEEDTKIRKPKGVLLLVRRLWGRLNQATYIATGDRLGNRGRERRPALINEGKRVELGAPLGDLMQGVSDGRETERRGGRTGRYSP
jgi:hypothetical protein